MPPQLSVDSGTGSVASVVSHPGAQRSAIGTARHCRYVSVRVEKAEADRTQICADVQLAYLQVGLLTAGSATVAATCNAHQAGSRQGCTC